MLRPVAAQIASAHGAHALFSSAAAVSNLSNAVNIIRPPSLGRFDVQFDPEHHKQLAESRKLPVTLFDYQDSLLCLPLYGVNIEPELNACVPVSAQLLQPCLAQGIFPLAPTLS